MKNLFLALFMVVLAIALVLSGCAKPAPAPVPSPKPAPAPAPTPAPAAKLIELKFAVATPVQSLYTDAHNNWIEKVEKATKGRVKITLYPAATLSKQGSAYYDLATGVADLCYELPQFYPGKFPLFSVFNLPFLGIEGIWDVGGIGWELYQKFPEIQAEFKEVKILGFCGGMEQVLGTTKKKVTKLEDIQGLKIRVGGKNATTGMKLLGAVPMSPPWGEVVPMLQKGVLDGAQENWGTISEWGHGEAIKYMFMMYLWVSEPFMAPAMSLEKWNSLPRDIQEAILSVTGLEMSMEYGRIAFETVRSLTYKWMKDKGVTIEVIEPTPEEKARWKDIGGKPVWDEWLAEMKAKGLPGQAVLDETLRLVKKYNQNPSRYK